MTVEEDIVAAVSGAKSGAPVGGAGSEGGAPAGSGGVEGGAGGGSSEPPTGGAAAPAAKGPEGGAAAPAPGAAAAATAGKAPESGKGAEGGAAGTGTGTGAAAPTAVTPEQASQVFLKDFSGGKYSSAKQIEEEINRISALEQQLHEARTNPTFKSEQAKVLWEYANKFAGMETEAFKSFLNIVSLPVDKLPDQQLRFEAFKLRPEFAGVSEDKLKGVFLEEEVQKFGDPENKDVPQTETQKTRAEIATRQARESILSVRKDFEKAQPAAKSPADEAKELADLRTNVEQALTGFKEINFAYKVPGENGEILDGALKFALDDPAKVRAIVEGTVNPLKMWEQQMQQEGVITGDGKVDLAKFGKIVAEFVLRKETNDAAYRQGHNDGRAYKVKTARNPGSTEGGGGTLPPGGEPAPKNDADGMGKALWNQIHGAKT